MKEGDMNRVVITLISVLILTSCSVATPNPTPTIVQPTLTTAPPKALDLFIEKVDMTQEQAEEALEILNSIGVNDISRLDFDKKELAGDAYITDIQGFPNARVYINTMKELRKITDSTTDMVFFNYLSGGAEISVTDFVISDNEKPPFINLAKEYVLKGLKAPSTASFPDNSNAIWDVERFKNVIQVTAWVDAENSFGAMLRNDFIVQIDYMTQDLLYLTIEGDHVYGERQVFRKK